MANNRAEGSAAWAGWIIFAGAMLLMLGTFNVFEGLVALFDDDRLVLVADKLVLVDLTAWGWTVLIFGVVMIATGIGLFAARTWGRVLGIIVVGLHALWQIASLGAYPVWSLLMIALDVVVMFALTARWSAVTAALDPFAEMGENRGQHTAVR
jgi:hypothetical protein